MSTKEQSLRTVIIAAVMIDLEYCNQGYLQQTRV